MGYISVSAAEHVTAGSISSCTHAQHRDKSAAAGRARMVAGRKNACVARIYSVLCGSDKEPRRGSILIGSYPTNRVGRTRQTHSMLALWSFSLLGSRRLLTVVTNCQALRLVARFAIIRNAVATYVGINTRRFNATAL